VLWQLKRDPKLRPSTRQAKYLNNRIEADHGPIKRLIRATLGFKSMKTLRHDQGFRGDADHP
jgi:IS6 family transposase